MVEFDKENADRLANAGSPCNGGSQARQLTLAVKQIFFGPIEYNPSSPASFKWDTNPNVSGRLSFQTLHGRTRTDNNITFEMFEGCFGFVTADSHNDALILKFRDPCQKRVYAKLMTRTMYEQVQQYGLNESSHCFYYLTIFLTASPNLPDDKRNVVAKDENNICYTSSELKSYMTKNMQEKFRQDGIERYFKLRKRDHHFDYCFYDVIKISEHINFLKKAGIAFIKSSNNKMQYEGTKPDDTNFDLHNTPATKIVEKPRQEASNEFVPGKKVMKMTMPHQPQHGGQSTQHGVKHGGQGIQHGRHGMQYVGHSIQQAHHGNYSQQGHKLAVPLSHLAIEQKHPHPATLGKRPRPTLEDTAPLPPMDATEMENDEDEEEMELDEEEEDEEGEEEEEEEEEEDDKEAEYSTSPAQKSQSPALVDILDDDEAEAEAPSQEVARTPEAAPAQEPVRIPQPTDVLLKYKNTTIHFDDMKGLLFDEMANDSLIDCYLSIMQDFILPPNVRDKTHIFSCFFYKRLTSDMAHGANYKSGEKGASFRFTSVERNYAAVCKWTRRIDIFKKDYIIVPVVDDLHWYLIIIVKPYKCIVPANGQIDNTVARKKGYEKKDEAESYIILLDSLYDPHCTKRQTTADIIRDYLELEYQQKKAASNSGMVFDRSLSRKMRPKALPQQVNFVDCGFYALRFCQTFLSRPPSDELLKSGVFWRDWFVGDEIGVKYMRDFVTQTIKTKADNEKWKEYKRYTKIKKAEWDLARKQREAVSLAKRRRCPSEEPAPKIWRVRRHSEPAVEKVPSRNHYS